MPINIKDVQQQYYYNYMYTSIVNLKLFILSKKYRATYLCWILSVEVTSRNGELSFSEYHLQLVYAYVYIMIRQYSLYMYLYLSFLCIDTIKFVHSFLAQR